MSPRSLSFIAVPLALVVLAGCGTPPAGFQAQVTRAPKAPAATMSGPVEAAWCPSRGILLLEGTEGDDGVALVWYYGDSLRNDSLPLAPALYTDTLGKDTVRARAAAAYRHRTGGSVGGYQSVDGWMVVRRAGADSVAAAFAGRFVQAAMNDTVRIEGTFAATRPATDSTLCRVPRSAPDPGVPLTQ
jgi:hypothetical protein